MVASRLANALFALPLMSSKLDKTFSGPAISIPATAPLLPTSPLGTAKLEADQLKLMSWNLLATPYVRHPKEAREDGMARAKTQIAYAAQENADVIGLQEFWSDSSELVGLWREFAMSNGYLMHVCPRTDRKVDGCAMLIRASICSATPEFEAFSYSDWGNRVLQVCKLPVVGASLPLTLYNTHLTFPHANEHDPVMRRHQARKLSEIARVDDSATVVFGDLNIPNEDDDALKVLTTLGGLTPLPPTYVPVLGGEGERWYSHNAHTGELMACDQVLTRGRCKVQDWRLGLTHKGLVERSLPSDHRPMHASILVGEAATEEEEEEVSLS